MASRRDLVAETAALNLPSLSDLRESYEQQTRTIRLPREYARATAVGIATDTVIVDHNQDPGQVDENAYGMIAIVVDHKLVSLDMCDAYAREDPAVTTAFINGVVFAAFRFYEEEFERRMEIARNILSTDPVLGADFLQDQIDNGGSYLASELGVDLDTV